MSLLDQVIVILSLLCCSWQVSSAPRIFRKNYIIPDEDLINGHNHIDKTKLVYALCKNGANDQTSQCNIIFERDPFDPTKPPYSCNVSISTELENGRPDVIGIELLTENIVIFLWRDIDNNNHRESWVTIEKIIMQTCRVLKRKFRTDNRDDMVPQIFVTTDAFDDDSYRLTFMYRFFCFLNMCTVTVFSNGNVGRIQPWFPRTLVHTLESIDEHTNKFLVTIGETEQDAGVVTYSILDGWYTRELTTSDNIGDLGWTNSNGFISLCNVENCRRYDHRGILRSTLTLDLQIHPTKYKALYDLPFGGYLALICDDEEDSHYRVIRIGNEGRQEYFYDLTRFKCSHISEYMAAKFFMKNPEEHCLSIFDRINQNLAIFEIYCFSIEDLFQANLIQP